MKLPLFLVFLLFLIACNHSSDKNSKYNLETKAYNAFKSGNYTNSINYYNELIKGDSLNGSYYYGRGYSYSMLAKKAHEAVIDFLKSAELNYRKGDSYYGIAIINTFLNDSLAAFYFRKSLETYSQLEDLTKRENIQEEYDACLKRIKKDSINSQSYK